MSDIKTGRVVEEFLAVVAEDVTESSLNLSNIEKIQKIEENFAVFETWGREQEGCLEKLAFISAILRESGKESLFISHHFDSTLVSKGTEQFTCSLLAEPYSNTNMPLKNLAIDKFELLKEKYIKGDYGLAKKEVYRCKKLTNQEENVLDLYNKIEKKIGDNNECALALTSYLLYEIESMSTSRVESMMLFYDLFDLEHVEDKWFSAISIDGKYVDKHIQTKTFIY